MHKPGASRWPSHGVSVPGRPRTARVHERPASESCRTFSGDRTAPYPGSRSHKGSAATRSVSSPHATPPHLESDAWPPLGRSMRRRMHKGYSLDRPSPRPHSRSGRVARRDDESGPPGSRTPISCLQGRRLAVGPAARMRRGEGASASRPGRTRTCAILFVRQASSPLDDGTKGTRTRAGTEWPGWESNPQAPAPQAGGFASLPTRPSRKWKCVGQDSNLHCLKAGVLRTPGHAHAQPTHRITISIYQWPGLELNQRPPAF